MDSVSTNRVNGMGSNDGEIGEISSRMEDKMVVSIDEINWVEAAKELENSVLLKLANNRMIQKKQLVDVLNKIWKLKGSVKFYKVEKTIMLATLASKDDQNKVLEGGPWSVEGTAILCQKWEPGMTGEDFVKTKINVWAHLYGLRFELRNIPAAIKIAEYAGRVKD